MFINFFRKVIFLDFIIDNL